MNRLTSIAQVKLYQPKPLSKATHQALLKTLNWFKADEGYTELHYRHSFSKDKMACVEDKLARIRCVADNMNHHPVWTNKMCELDIHLTTHDIGDRVSLKDYILASWIEKVLRDKPLEEQLCENWNAREFMIEELMQ